MLKLYLISCVSVCLIYSLYNYSITHRSVYTVLVLLLANLTHCFLSSKLPYTVDLMLTENEPIHFIAK